VQYNKEERKWKVTLNGKTGNPTAESATRSFREKKGFGTNFASLAVPEHIGSPAKKRLH